MAPWENDPSSSLREAEKSYILLRKTSEVRTFSDTGGKRKNIDFQVAVLCMTCVIKELPCGTGCFASNLCRDILWEYSHIRRLRFVGSFFFNSSIKVRVPFVNKNKRQRNSDNFLLLTSNTKATGYILISFFRRAKHCIKPVPVTNTNLLSHRPSISPSWMLLEHLTVLKHIHFFHILFVGKFHFPFWYMSSSVGFYKHRQESFVSSVTCTRFAKFSARKKLHRHELGDLRVYFITFCSLWSSFIVDSGSRKWWIDQGHSKNLGPVYKHLASVYEGDVSCGQCTYSNNRDRRYSFSNTAAQVQFLLFFLCFYPLLLLWKRNDRHEDTEAVVTARNHGDKNVRTTFASLLPLCSAMLASLVSSLDIQLQAHLCSKPSREATHLLRTL